MTCTPCTPLILATSLDQLDAHALALRLCAFGGPRPLDALDDCVRDVDAGHVRAHPSRRLRRAQRPDADQDEHALVQAEVARARHEGCRERHVVAVLRLDELRARPRSSWRSGAGASRAAARTDSPRRRGTRAGREVSLRPLRKRPSSRMVRPVCEQRDAVEVEHRLGLRLVAALHAVAGEAQMFCTPIAAAPSTSPWIAIRLRSRQEICITGA